jgi:chromosome segregation ATPase
MDDDKFAPTPAPSGRRALQMSQPPKKRAFGALRRWLRGRRAPRPKDQEWLRLILLVRKLQHHQLAFVQRFDEIRALTGALGSFKSDFGALHEQLGAARITAAELESGLASGLDKLQALPDPKAEHAELDRRIANLDGLSQRLETLAAATPGELPFSAELGTVLAELKSLASRMESAQREERNAGGQTELAQLYERMQELAEGLAQGAQPDAGADARQERFEEQLARLENTLAALSNGTLATGDDGAETITPGPIERLEALASRLEGRGGGDDAAPALAGVLARFEELAQRLESLPNSLPELPPSGANLAEHQALTQQFTELRAAYEAVEDSRLRLGRELEALKAQLRASELARMELENKHATELSQVADHAQRQIARLEDDIKKKKRGLSELTQRNIDIQNENGKLKAELAAQDESPPAVRPRAGGQAISSLMTLDSPPPAAPPPGGAGDEDSLQAAPRKAGGGAASSG